MTTVFTLFAHSILLMALLLAIFQVRRWKQYWPVPYIVAAIIIVLPVSNWLVIEFSMGYLSDLSMATILVCLAYIVSGMRRQPIVLDNSLKLFVLLICMILFPSSLGATQYDLFSLGFPSESGFNGLVMVFTAIGLIAWYKQAFHLAIYIALVLCTYALGLYDTQNIWVYMVDPIVMLVFITGYLKVGFQIMFKIIKTRLVKHA